ncbi:unnamed protein product [Merluccius merluccius]
MSTQNHSIGAATRHLRNDNIRNNNISFSVNGEKIPLLVDQPVRSLERLYTADLSDKHMAAIVTSQLSDGLSKIDKAF